jgi:hypothetical protein
MPVQSQGQGDRVGLKVHQGHHQKETTAMAKGMNKRKEVKKPKKEAAKPAVSVASSNAKVTISPGKSKD